MKVSIVNLAGRSPDVSPEAALGEGAELETGAGVAEVAGVSFSSTGVAVGDEAGAVDEGAAGTVALADAEGVAETVGVLGLVGDADPDPAPHEAMSPPGAL